MHVVSESLAERAVTWRVLRPETLEIDGEPVGLHRRPQSVLICMLLRANEVVSTDAICDFVWGEQLPKTAMNSVARFVADIRKVLGPLRDRLATVTGGYRLEVRPGELDIDVARTRLADARRLRLVDPNRSAEYLMHGIDLLGRASNPALDELTGTSATARSHNELRVATLELFGEVGLRQGKATELVPMLEDAVVDHPFHEQYWVQLMMALGASGRSVEALRAGHRGRDALADAGLEPGLEFRQIESSIAGTSVPAATGQVLTFPVAASRSVHRISEPTTRLVGRRHELRQLESLVAAEQVISVVGLGGSGKTRLALAVMTSLEATGAEVFRIGLRSTAEDRLVVSTIANALGIPAGQASDATALAQAVSRDNYVLLLDNCEHVLQGCIAAVTALVALAPGVTVVTTTRQALGVDQEHVFQLGLLALPGQDEISATPAAVAMLIDRAEPHLRSAGQIRGGLHHLCQIARHLCGHPLATEVAAAQLAYMTLEELAASLGELFQDHDAGQEQPLSSLTQVMDWSWNVLTPSQQAVIARVSVLGGSWPFEAAAALCAEQTTLAQDLTGLEATGLLVAHMIGDSTRYELSEPARRFALDRLHDRAEFDVMHDRLARWLEELAAQWTAPQQHTWAASSSRLVQERGSLLVALTYLHQAGRHTDVARLATGYSGMLINHGFADEVTLWLEPIVDDSRIEDSVRSGAAAMALAAAHASGDLEHLSQMGMRSIELAAGEPHDWIPAVASFLGLWSLFTPGLLSTNELFELSRTAAKQSRSVEENLAITELYEAHVLFCTRQFSAAATIFADVLGRMAEPGRLRHVAEVGLGLAHMLGGDLELARSTTEAWQSRSDTDEWHYMVDVARAVVLGGSGSAVSATSELAAAVRRLPSARVWGRSDEIQLAFALLALFRGENELADELLATVATRDVLLTVTAIELVAHREGTVDDASWFGIAEEFWSRGLPDPADCPSVVANTPELVSLWLVGSAVGAKTLEPGTRPLRGPAAANLS